MQPKNIGGSVGIEVRCFMTSRKRVRSRILTSGVVSTDPLVRQLYYESHATPIIQGSKPSFSFFHISKSSMSVTPYTHLYPRASDAIPVRGRESTVSYCDGRDSLRSSFSTYFAILVQKKD